MANEVEIVVKSTDRTDFSKYGAKARTEISRGVKAGMDDVEKAATGRFSEIGDRSGRALSEQLDEHLQRWAGNLGDEVTQPLTHSFDQAANDVDNRVTSRFKEIGDRSGEGMRSGFGHSFGSLVHDVDRGFSEMASSGSKFGSVLSDMGSKLSEMGPVAIVAIANAIAMLPAIASIAGGAITLALGGALAGIAILAQAKNVDVQNAFSRTKQHIVSEFTKISAPFHDTLLHMASDATHAFDSMAPTLGKAFSTMAPAVTRFSANFSASLSKLNPAIASIGTSFSKVLDNLGPQLPVIMNNIGTGIKAITDAAAKNPGAITGFVKSVSEVFRYLGDGIGILIRFKDQFNLAFMMTGGGPQGFLKLISQIGAGITKLKGLFGGGIFGDFAGKLTGVSDAANDSSKTLDNNTGSTKKLLTAQQLATYSSEQLSNALDKLTGKNQSAWDAQTQVNEALKAAAKQAKASNAGFDGNSDAVNKNRQALSDLAQAMKNQIANGHLSGKQVDDLHDKFVHAAEGMGASKKEAEDLAEELLGVKDGMDKIPPKKNTNLTAKDQTKGPVKDANKGLSGFAKRVWRAQLTAQNKVSGAVKKAGELAAGFAKRLYRANLTATNKVGSAVKSAITACAGFVKRTYRASLTAANRVGSALRSAISLGQQWAGRVFTATFNVFKSINPFNAHGGIIGGLATGGMPRGMASGGPGGSLTWVGEQGAELVRLPTGSQVYPHGQSMGMAAQMGGGESRTVIELRGDGSRLANLLIEVLRTAINDRGGNVQTVLGRG